MSGLPRAVVFRCDGSASLGIGHVQRCSVLARELASRGCRTAFLTRNLPSAPLELLHAAGFAVELLTQSSSEEHDQLATESLARQLGANWIVVDRYAATEQQLEALAEPGCHVLAIDDVCEHAFPVTMLLNQNATARDARYITRSDTVRLLGPHYALLARAYLHARPPEPQGARPCRRLLVFMGGGDVVAALVAVARALHSTANELEVRVIVGSPFHDRAVADVRETLPKARVEHGFEDLVEPLRWADLLVTAGGSVVWEACCLGVAMLVLPIAANQELNAAKLQQLGAASHPASLNQLSAEALAQALTALTGSPERLLSLRRTAWGLVDGRGASRVVDAIERYGA